MGHYFLDPQYIMSNVCAQYANWTQLYVHPIEFGPGCKLFLFIASVKHLFSVFPNYLDHSDLTYVQTYDIVACLRTAFVCKYYVIVKNCIY